MQPEMSRYPGDKAQRGAAHDNWDRHAEPGRARHMSEEAPGVDGKATPQFGHWANPEQEDDGLTGFTDAFQKIQAAAVYNKRLQAGGIANRRMPKIVTTRNSGPMPQRRPMAEERMRRAISGKDGSSHLGAGERDGGNDGGHGDVGVGDGDGFLVVQGSSKPKAKFDDVGAALAHWISTGEEKMEPGKADAKRQSATEKTVPVAEKVYLGKADATGLNPTELVTEEGLHGRSEHASEVEHREKETDGKRQNAAEKVVVGKAHAANPSAPWKVHPGKADARDPSAQGKARRVRGVVESQTEAERSELRMALDKWRSSLDKDGGGSARMSRVQGAGAKEDSRAAELGGVERREESEGGTQREVVAVAVGAEVVAGRAGCGSPAGVGPSGRDSRTSRGMQRVVTEGGRSAVVVEHGSVAEQGSGMAHRVQGLGERAGLGTDATEAAKALTCFLEEEAEEVEEEEERVEEEEVEGMAEEDGEMLEEEEGHDLSVLESVPESPEEDEEQEEEEEEETGGVPEEGVGDHSGTGASVGIAGHSEGAPWGTGAPGDRRRSPSGGRGREEAGAEELSVAGPRPKEPDGGAAAADSPALEAEAVGSGGGNAPLAPPNVGRLNAAGGAAAGRGGGRGTGVARKMKSGPMAYGRSPREDGVEGEGGGKDAGRSSDAVERESAEERAKQVPRGHTVLALTSTENVAEAALLQQRLAAKIAAKKAPNMVAKERVVRKEQFFIRANSLPAEPGGQGHLVPCPQVVVLASAPRAAAGGAPGPSEGAVGRGGAASGAPASPLSARGGAAAGAAASPMSARGGSASPVTVRSGGAASPASPMGRSSLGTKSHISGASHHSQQSWDSSRGVPANTPSPSGNSQDSSKGHSASGPLQERGGRRRIMGGQARSPLPDGIDLSARGRVRLAAGLEPMTMDPAARPAASRAAPMTRCATEPKKASTEKAMDPGAAGAVGGLRHDASLATKASESGGRGTDGKGQAPPVPRKGKQQEAAGPIVQEVAPKKQVVIKIFGVKCMTFSR